MSLDELEPIERAIMPALLSSAAITPPTAPMPTMTTSVFSVAIGHTFRVGALACACKPMMGARVNACLLAMSAGV